MSHPVESRCLPSPDRLPSHYALSEPLYDAPMERGDTSEKAENVQLEIWRQMRPEQKLELMRELTLAVQNVAFAEMKQSHPDLSADEIWLRLAARRLPAALMKKAYGRTFEIE